jgi:hypothetical protein
MPVVPVARNLVNLPSPGVSARIDTPNMAAGGEMVGRAVQGLGADLAQVAQDQEVVSTIHDHAAVKEATNNVLQWFTQAGYTGPDAFFNKDGRDAVEGQPRISDGLDNLIKTTRAGLNDDRQRQMFDLAIGGQRADWATAISRHAATQEKVYDDGQSKALLTSASELAKAQYVSDPDAAEKQIDTGLAEISIYGAKNGMSREEIGAKQLEYASGIYKDVGANLAYVGPDGPKLADALVEKHGGSMTADDRYAVSTHARTAQNALDAEQRRVEAEQRQLANEAKHDARDRASSAAASLDSGLPMNPKDYASAMSDARTAEDESLQRRLEQGQLKNTVLFSHQKDTPPQLQDTINQLSAKIAKDGTKADPNEIITRDALQQLYGHSSEQLRSNGLAWGAAHLGIAPQSLNINDPNSVNARVSLVGQISKRTGRDIAPFQPDEVAPFAQTWRSGDAAAKAGLVMRLSTFGALAPAAAQQIAPNDAGLLHLMSLASHSNKGVGASRVAQAMAGYEAMKTEGQIDLEPRADRFQHMGRSVAPVHARRARWRVHGRQGAARRGCFAARLERPERRRRQSLVSCGQFCARSLQPRRGAIWRARRAERRSDHPSREHEPRRDGKPRQPRERPAVSSGGQWRSGTRQRRGAAGWRPQEDALRSGR